MATFSQTIKRTPPATFLLKAEHWASSYTERPVLDLRVGLRMLSDEELESCRNEADKAAQPKLDESAQAFIRAHERKLIRSAVSRALCMPDDSTKAHEFFPCPDDQIEYALREETIVTLYDIVVRAQLENSPVFLPLDNDGIADLMVRISEGGLDELEKVDELKAAQVRRLLMFCLQELTDAG